ncbi:MAG: glycosyltransferase family 2 protein [Bacteroidales bacterium]|nr:glycosyltransferase family 2 protein [Bacteroidales bacterium]
MISVCLPTYNGEKFIQQQLDSILNQSVAINELIISDDSSTDRTIEIIKSYTDNRITLIENQKFSSPVFNLENALKQAKGDYIFLADQDDIWYPNKVKIVLEHLENHNLVVSDCKLIDKDNTILVGSFYKLINSGQGFFKNFIKNTYLGCCMAFDRSVLEYVLPFPKSIAIHDHWIGLNAELFSSIYFCDEQLVGYRKHENNQTPFTGGVSKNSFIYKLIYRVEMLMAIVMNVIKKLKLKT